jgi:hypothetical protein
LVEVLVIGVGSAPKILAPDLSTGATMLGFVNNTCERYLPIKKQLLT